MFPNVVGFYVENLEPKDLFMMVSIVVLSIGMIILFRKKK